MFPSMEYDHCENVYWYLINLVALPTSIAVYVIFVGDGLIYLIAYQYIKSVKLKLEKEEQTLLRLNLWMKLEKKIGVFRQSQ